MTTRAGCACAAASALLAFSLFFRLGAAQWNLDELAYARAGAAYVHGHFTLNPQHPLLAKLLFGFSELIFGQLPFAVRLVSALAAAAIGVGLAVVAARHWGPWPAALVLVLWAVLPHAPLPVSRLGLLEPVMTLLAGACLLFGWRWLRTGAWRWALASGAAAGLAGGAKLTGLTVLLAVIAVVAGYDRRRATLIRAAGAVGAATVALGITYLPAGARVPALVRSMLRFQFHHAQVGHPVLLAGHVYQRAPWWTLGYYQVRADGWATTIALLVLAVVAVAWSRGIERQLSLLLMLATVIPVAALSLSPVQLPHYGYVSQPWLVLLSVGGVVQVWRRAADRRWAITVASAATAVPLAFTAVTGMSAAFATEPDGYADLPRMLAGRADAPDLHVAVWGYAPLAGAYLGPSAQPMACAAASCQDIAVVVDPAVANRFDDASVRRLLDREGSGLKCQQLDELRVCSMVRLRPDEAGLVRPLG